MFWFISSDFLPYFWLILALIFLFAEVGTPGLFFFVAFSIGFFITALLAFLGFSFVIQCWSAIICSLLAFWILRYYFSVKGGRRVGTNVEALIGKRGVVLKTIEPNKIGKVKIGGEVWSAVSKDTTVLQPQAVVEVVDVEGNKLVVKAV